MEVEEEVEEGVGGVATADEEMSYLVNVSSISVSDMLRCFFIAMIFCFSTKKLEKLTN